jgi:phage terminase large subunit
MAEVLAKFPPKLRPLFQPKRYKVAHGGRGGAKSWGFARALLTLAAQKPLRILCTREVQKSIKDSVHRLLNDQAQALGLGAFYEVLESEIRGANGSLFLFAGLASHTVESIKSYEGVDIVWVEEAHKVSKRSWDILVPTIRKPGSEIWISLNPELETDETYVRFVSNPSDDTVVIQINWRDNPWFPSVLDAERIKCKETRPEHEYNWIWEGKCLPAAEGAIYHGEITQAQEQGRVRDVPPDALLKTHAIWDLGWNDCMSIILVQRSASEIRVIDYIEDSHRTLSDYVLDLQQMRVNWGYDWLPHDGAAKDFKTGKSAQEMLASMGRKPQITPNISIESGIRAAREVFPRVYFDKNKCSRLIDCLKHYRRHVVQTTGEAGAPLHDEYSHGADAFRYLAVNADQLRNDPVKQLKKINTGIM